MLIFFLQKSNTSDPHTSLLRQECTPKTDSVADWKYAQKNNKTTNRLPKFPPSTAPPFYGRGIHSPNLAWVSMVKERWGHALEGVKSTVSWSNTSCMAKREAEEEGGCSWPLLWRSSQSANNSTSSPLTQSTDQPTTPTPSSFHVGQYFQRSTCYWSAKGPDNMVPSCKTPADMPTKKSTFNQVIHLNFIRL